MNKKQSNILSYIFDLIMIFILIVFILLDILVFKETNSETSYQINEVSSVIITLIPCIITIISISLSMSKEKIYGVTFNEISSIRGSFYFTFFHMILITCGIIGIYSTLSFFGLKKVIYSLELISLIYSLIFSIQEIPILCHSKWIIKKILNENYLKISRNNLLYEQESTNIFNIMIRNIVFTEGIGTAFNLLNKNKKEKEKNIELLDYLLSMQNEYLWKVLESLSLEKTSLSDTYYDVSILNAIDKCYDNIKEMVSGDYEKYLLTKFEKEKYYHITRSIYSLHNLCSKLGLQNKEKEKMIPIITHSGIFSFLEKNNDLGMSIIIGMLASTLNEGKVWFVKLVRDNNLYPSAIFDFEECSIGIFTCMMISHLFSKRVLNENEEKEIKNFIEEQAQGINADGSTWKQLMQRAIEFSRVEKVTDSILQLLKYYDSINECDFYFHGTQKKSVYDATDNFTKQNVFHDWLLLIFLSAYHNFLSIDLENIFNQLNADNKKILVEELSDNWFENGNIKEGINMAFFAFFEIGVPTNLFKMSFAKELIKQLVSLHDSYYKTIYCSSLNLNDNENSLIEDKEIIIKATKDAIIKNPFYDETLPVDNEPKKCFSFIVKEPEHRKILEMYLEKLPISFIKMINDSLEDKIGKISDEEKVITDDIVREIIDLNPRYSSYNYSFDSYIMNNNEYTEQFSSLNIKNIPALYPGLFLKENAIRFNTIVDEDLTFIRQLNNEELEKIIIDEYKPFDNGLYRYSKFDNDSKHDFYVTKEELMEYLKETIFYVSIVFKSAINIDDSKIINLNNDASI